MRRSTYGQSNLLIGIVCLKGIRLNTERLADVSIRVFEGAAAITSKQKSSYGFSVIRKSFFTPEYQCVAAEVYDHDNPAEKERNFKKIPLCAKCDW